MGTEVDVPAGGRRLRPAARRAVVRLAEVACPPQARSLDLDGDLVAEFEALLKAAPPGAGISNARVNGWISKGHLIPLTPSNGNAPGYESW